MFTIANQPEVNFKDLDDAQSFLSRQVQESKPITFEQLSLKDGDIALNGEVLAITKLAKRQLLSELVPGGTFFLNSKDVPADLKHTVVSRMLQEKKDISKVVWTEQVPGKDPYIKAIVSDKYAFYSNKQLVEQLSTITNAQVIRPSLEEGRFSVSLVDPKAPVLGFKDKNSNDREIFMGSTYSNGEGGQRALLMQPFSFDRFCKNGAIFGKKFIEALHARKIHYGSSVGMASWASIKFEAIATEHLTFVGKAYANLMNTAMTSLYYKYILEQAQEVISAKSFESIVPFVENESRFDTYNRINEYAHAGQNSQDIRMGLEQLAGGMVEDSFLA